MSITRRVLGLAAVVLTCTVGVAGAAPQPPVSGKVAGGFAAVTPCGSVSAATVSWSVRGGSVVGVTVANLPSNCNGGRLSLTLTGSAAASLGGVGPATVAGGTVTGVLSANPTASSVTGAQLVISGP